MVFLAGPLFNFIFAIIIYNLRIELKLKTSMFYMNLVLAFLNLFPILPLDGGNILRCILEQKLDFEKSVNISFLFGKITLIFISLLYSIMIFYLKNFWIFLSILYLWYLYLKEEQKYRIYIKIKNRVQMVINNNIKVK